MHVLIILLLALSFGCFILSALGIAERRGFLVPLGLALWVLSALIQLVGR